MARQVKGQLPPDQLAAMKKAVSEAFRDPPTIGVIGVSGVGKSSTINAMFKTNLPISHTTACTAEFQDVDLKTEIRDEGVAHGQAVALRVVDAPGLGEDIAKDPEYLAMYRRHLDRCDVILWVISARNRGIALDQQYLNKLKKYHKKIVFGINQIELVDPMNWSRINMPSVEQEENLQIILDDREKRIQSVLNAPVRITLYSAQRGYNLQELFTNLIDSCNSKRAWMFGAIKSFSPEDFIPAEYRDAVRNAAEQKV